MSIESALMRDRYIAIETSLIIISKIGGAISFISSLILGRYILKSKPTWREISLTNVMLFCISVENVMTSFFGYFMGSWMVGSDTRGFLSYGFKDSWTRPLAAGNTATCTTQGFFMLFGFAYMTTAYALLGALYCLIVRRGWTSDQLKQRRFRAMFLLPQLVFALAMSVPPLFFTMYNPSYLFCYAEQYPFMCEWDPTVQCSRGNNALVVQYTALIYAMVCNVIIIIFMIALVHTVHKQESKSDQYLTKGQQRQRQNTINTAWQGIRYSAAITIPFAPLYVFFFYSIRSRWMREMNFLFWSYITAIFTPLIGFNNAYVFFYPRYKSYRQQNQDKSRMHCIFATIGIGSPTWKPWKRSEDRIETTSDDSDLTDALVENVI